MYSSVVLFSNIVMTEFHVILVQLKLLSVELVVVVNSVKLAILGLLQWCATVLIYAFTVLTLECIEHSYSIPVNRQFLNISGD